MPGEEFRVFTEIPNNEKMIVNMITNDQLTLEDACNLLNKQDQEIKELTSFKNKVFTTLDEETKDTEKYNHVDTSTYYARRQLLQDLKKRLEK